MLAAANQEIENKVISYLKIQTPEQIALLEQLVNINSGTTNTAGVHQVGELVRKQFDDLGFKTYWIEEPANMHRAGTLIAQHEGDKGKRVLLIGHLDTVFSPDSPFQGYKKQGKWATGPGVIDDKGGIVVLLYALKALQKAHALEHAQITVLLTGDEEDSGKPTSISRKPLIDAAKNSDIALDFEWSINQDTATIARRGIASWVLTTSGNEAHSSEIFRKQVGYGAIFELARILNTMRSQLAKEIYLTFNPGLMAGGTTIEQHALQASAAGKGNIIAKTAMSSGDLRYISATQRLKAQEKIIAIVKQHLPGTNASIRFQEGIPSMPPSKNNYALLKQYSDISIRLGYGAVHALNPGLRGAGDISHIATIISAALAGLGPVGTNAHSTKETLDLNSLPMQSLRAALLIYQLINTPSV